MNHIELTGRLTRDPEVHIGEKTRANFTIAVDRRSKYDGDKTDYFRCVVFGESAKTIGDCFYKGKPIVLIRTMTDIIVIHGVSWSKNGSLLKTIRRMAASI